MGVRRLAVEARELTGWDSGLVTFLRNVAGVCAQHQIAFHRDGLPEGVRRLLDLAAATLELSLPVYFRQIQEALSLKAFRG